MAKKFKTGIIITGDAKGGVKAIKATDSQLKTLDRQQKRNTRSAAKMASAFSHVRRNARRYSAALGVAVVGIVALTARQAAAVRDTDSLARALGVSTGEFQAFQYAAEQAGIGADKAGDIIKDVSDKLGDASLTGGGEMADVLDRIGLSAEELLKSGPVDQLVAISGAIKDLPKAQQVTVMESIADDATRLLPLMRDNAKLLREYSQEAKDFGIALGDDDVNRLLAANRATARFSGAMRGLGNDIAIAVAPAMTSAIDDMGYLRDIVGDSGFQQNLSTLASAFARTAGFLAEGTREFVTFGNQIGTAAAHLAGYSNELDDIGAKLQRLESLRGSSTMSRAGLFSFAGEFDTFIDDSDIDRYVTKLKARRAEIAGEMASVGQDTAGGSLAPIDVKPDPYASLTDEYDKQHRKLVQLREDRTKLQKAIADDPDNAGAYRRSLSSVNDQIDRLNNASLGAAGALGAQQKAAARLTDQYDGVAATLRRQIALSGETGQAADIRYQIEQGGLQGLDAARERNLTNMAREIDALEAQRTAVQSLFPEWQKLQQASQLRQSVSDLPEGMQEFGQRRAAQIAGESATAGLPGMQGLDPEYNGAFGEAQRLGDERGEYQQAYERRRESFLEYARTHEEDKATADAAIEALDKAHQQRMTQYQEQEQSAQRQGYANLFGELTSLTGQFAGEQSGIYKVMFAASKGFAIADSIVQIQGAIAKAANLPFPANLGAMATVAASTASIVGNIQSVSLSGQAHDGIDSVPNTGTWNLERGERVIDRRTNVDLKQYLQRENTGDNSSSAPNVTLHMPITVEGKPGMSDAESREQGQQVGSQARDMVLGVIDNEFRSGGRFSNVKRSA